MPWSITPQETRNGAVLCKCIKCYQQKNEETGEITFGRLRSPIYQIVLVSTKGATLVLKACYRDGINRPTFKIQYPGKRGRPTFWIGKGKSRRQITDVLAQPVNLPGEEESFPGISYFEPELQQRFGEDVAAQIMRLFAVGC